MMTAHRIVALAVAGATSCPVVSADDCSGWDVNGYFRTASVEDVAECVRSRFDFNARGELDRTPLHIAAMHGERPLVITALVAAGADTRMRDRRDHTPLHSAALASRSAAVIDALVRAGADPDAPSLPASMEDLIAPAGESSYSFYGFELWGTPWFFENLQRRRELSALGGSPLDNGHPMVPAAVLGGENPTVFSLIAELATLATPVGRQRDLSPGSDPSAPEDSLGAMSELLGMLKSRDTRGLRPVHVAARFNDTPAVIDALADAGADMNAPTVHEYNALHLAAGYGERPAVVRALVDAGVNLRARDTAGGTPLHVAASTSFTPSVVKALLDAGARLDARDERDRTPLHRAYARFHPSTEVIEVLLDAGADPTARDSLGRSPTELKRW